MPASTRRVCPSGALALSMGPACAATAPLRIVASSAPHADILESVGETLAPELPLTMRERARDGLALERAEHNPDANVLVPMESVAMGPRERRLASLPTSADVAALIRARYRGSVIAVHPT